MTEDEIKIKISKGHFVPWKWISKNVFLSEKFIRNHQNNLSWFNTSWYQTLSEEFIREFSDEVDWANICFFQKLSCKFIKEFSDKLDWNDISSHQKLSEEFIKEFSGKVKFKCIPLCYFKINHEYSWKTFL